MAGLSADRASGAEIPPPMRDGGAPAEPIAAGPSVILARHRGTAVESHGRLPPRPAAA